MLGGTAAFVGESGDRIMRPPRRTVKRLKSAGILSQTAKLERITFSTSRLLDFFSEKELVTQTGHEMREWSLVFIKEAIDNALDACEEADIAPVIDVIADATGITVKDNGSGLPESTLNKQFDFSTRSSSREGYVGVCRGAQGNALHTLIPMPRVIDEEHGKLIVTAHGKRHVIRCGADPISQRPVIHDETSELDTTGTELRIEWLARAGEFGGSHWPFGGDFVQGGAQCGPIAKRFREIVEGFALFNPHATIRLDWFGEKSEFSASNPDWENWKPHQPTSAHWYEAKHLERIVGAYITHERETGTDRLVSDFVAEFDGLTGSGKRAAVLDASGLKRVRLSELVVGDRLDSERIAKLLVAMQQHSHPANPKRLGIIGEDHFRRRLLDMGVQPESFRYAKVLDMERLPSVLETAFGWLGDEANDYRRIYAGANWSAAIKNPFRSFGASSEGLEAHLASMKAGACEPIVFAIHLAQPRIEFTDRGKSALIVGDRHDQRD